MARYRLDRDGESVVVDTEKAKAHWDEATRWNGNNHISRATGSQWEHETLYLSSKGNYYIEHTSQWQGSTPSARLVTEEEAARWILINDGDLPGELEAYENEVCE